jgi:hypothetical protein
MTAAILLRDDFEVRLFGSWRGNRAMPVRQASPEPVEGWRWPRFSTATRARTRPGPNWRRGSADLGMVSEGKSRGAAT